MATSNTPRFNLPQWSEGTDPRPGRVDTNTFLKAIEDKAAIFIPTAPLADRPAAGIPGRLFVASDQGAAGRLYYDTGSAWIEASTVGGGGPGANIVIGGTPSEGISNRSSRADHTHNIPLATSTNHGALSSEWAGLLGTANIGNTNNSLAIRTGSGSVRGSNPIHDQDLVPKKYAQDNFWGRDEASGGISGTAGKLVLRGSDMNFLVPAPSHGNHPATKSYVDGKTWSAADITSGVLSYYRVEGSRSAHYTAWGGSGTIRSVHTTSSGEFCYYSSTRRHKTNISLWAPDPRKLLAVEPAKFDRIDPAAGQVTNPNEIGVIAEQAGESLPEFLDLDINPDGTTQIAGWNYLSWSVAHQVVLRWLNKRLDDLETYVDVQDEELQIQRVEIDTLKIEVEDLKVANVKLRALVDSKTTDIVELRKYLNDMDERLRYLEDPNA